MFAGIISKGQNEIRQLSSGPLREPVKAMGLSVQGVPNGTAEWTIWVKAGRLPKFLMLDLLSLSNLYTPMGSNSMQRLYLVKKFHCIIKTDGFCLSKIVRWFGE